ncbi:MAG: SGNH/GDSL hydrolase family protein [Verrucomicrobiae bacterium]|nr:SGNH/GDSL hydrolase family protein [Verrucomicrobiae bacterium]
MRPGTLRFLIVLLCLIDSGLPLTAQPPHPPFRLLFLGDSYTVGEGVSAAESFPAQVVARLQEQGVKVEPPVIIAKTGWTSKELLKALQERKPAGPFDLVVVLIGANDQFRYEDEETDYRPRMEKILEKSLALVGGNPEKVLVVSIPDWSVTPFAKGKDRGRLSRDIDGFNYVALVETGKTGVGYLDLWDLSRTAGEDPTLICADGLHPSARMYALWAEELLRFVAAEKKSKALEKLPF